MAFTHMYHIWLRCWLDAAFCLPLRFSATIHAGVLWSLWDTRRPLGLLVLENIREFILGSEISDRAIQDFKDSEDSRLLHVFGLLGARYDRMFEAQEMAEVKFCRAF